jgi:ssDNA-binding Zn-finger/Zn-ribbon topoisomerase 1
VTVTCPNCDTEFDAVARSTGFTRTRRGREDTACPNCEATWVDIHRALEPEQDPSYEIGFDGDIRREGAQS